MPDKSRSLEDDALAREVDRLLRKLPGADPYLRGDPEPATRPAASAPTSLRAAAPVAQPRKVGPSKVQRIAVWVRVFLGAILGALLLQWPYARSCGLGLGLYLGAVSMIALGGIWGGVWSWRYRMGIAHAASLLVIAWGVALGAHEVLERNGYAVVTAAWSCGTK